MRLGGLGAPGKASGKPGGGLGRLLESLGAASVIGKPGRFFCLFLVIYSKDHEGKTGELEQSVFGGSPGWVFGAWVLGTLGASGDSGEIWESFWRAWGQRLGRPWAAWAIDLLGFGYF